MKLLPLGNIVMFQFLEQTIGKQGSFLEKPRESGIVILSSKNSQKVHRWGRVFAAGPKAEVKEGDLILIEALMWMEGVKLDDDTKVWKTDDSKILCVADSEEDCHPQYV